MTTTDPIVLAAISKVEADLQALYKLIPAPPVPVGTTMSQTPIVDVPGSQVVLADAFGAGSPAIGSAASFWGPNRDPRSDPRPGFNSNEVAEFFNSQVALGPGGLVLTAVPRAGLAAPYRYASGCAVSAPVNVAAGGAPGWPIKGFTWVPTAGVNTVFEFDLTIPAYTPGMDLGLWLSGYQGKGEEDIAEIMDEVVGNPGMSSMVFNVLNHVSGATSPNELQVFSNAWLKNGGRAKLTTVVSGVSTLTAYLQLAGGATQTLGSEKFPAPWNISEPQSLILSHGYRDIEADEATSFTDSRAVTIHSVLVRSDNPAKGFTGGGTQAGTLLA